MINPDFKPSTALPEFLAQAQVNRNSSKTYESVLNVFIKYLTVNKIKFNSVSRVDVINFKKYLEQKYEPKTINLYLSIIKQFYMWAGISAYYTDIARGIKLTKTNQEFKRMPLTKTQVNKLLSSIDLSSLKGKRDHALINLMVLTGLRRVEVTRLDIGDLVILNDKYCLHIQRKGHIRKDQYKPISPELYCELQGLISQREHYKETDPLFIGCTIGRKNTRLSVFHISRTVKNYMINIGLTNRLYSCHSLRHTTAVMLFDLGYDLHYVQMFMGHNSPATTQIYSKIINDRIAFDESGINSIEKFLG